MDFSKVSGSKRASKFQNIINAYGRTSAAKKGSYEKDETYWYPERDSEGNAQATIRFLPGLESEGEPCFVELFSHGYKSASGQWLFENCPTTSGKKKCHTQKAQLMVNSKSQEVICTDFSKGKKHDFQLFKEGRSMMSPDICGVGDTGYQGLANLHQNSQTPVKKSKRRPLTKEQKLNNRKLARERILVEHVIRRLKIFRILKECYRNRRKRFALRFNLIAAIHNLELNLIL